MKNPIIYSILALVLFQPLSAATHAHIDSVRVEHHDARLMMSYNLSIPTGGGNLRPTSRLTVTPVLRGADGKDSLAFSPIVIAGRRAYYTDLRKDGDLKDIYMNGSSLSVPVEHRIDYMPWMENATLCLRYDLSGCCNTPQATESSREVGLDLSPRVFAPAFCYITPEPGEATVKMRELRGSAYIDFPVNRTEIHPDYRRNPEELAKINATIDSIRYDSDISIKRITIKGFASPEGSYENNVRLARGRTRTLAEYVRTLHSFSPELMETDWEAEDWDGLRRWVETSGISNREAILSVINDELLLPDDKDNRLRKEFATEYKFLLSVVYPALRHSDYTIEYVIRNYTEPAEILEIARVAPQKLSLDELYLAANHYEQGSREYTRLWEIAAMMYPESEPAAVNAANGYMKTGALAKAEELLDGTEDNSVTVYAKGNLAALKGDYALARKLFEKADSLQNTAAADAIMKIEELDRPLYWIIGKE